MPMELIISSVGAALAAICYFCQAGAWRTQEIAAKAAPKLGVDVVNTFIYATPPNQSTINGNGFLMYGIL